MHFSIKKLSVFISFPYLCGVKIKVMNVQFEDENLKELVETGKNKKYKIRIMETKNDNIRPFMAVHPGSVLRDELEARAIRPESFSHQLGVPFDVLEGVLDEKQGVDSVMAAHLEQTLGISAAFWMSLQSDYEKDSEALKKQKKSKKRSMLGKLPWNKVAL